MPHRHEHDHELDRLHVEVLELEAELVVRLADVNAGLVPAGARRTMLPHERIARVNFARIADDVDRHAGVIAARLGRHRRDVIRLIEQWLAAAPSVEVMAERIRALIDPGQVAAVADELGQLVAAVEADLRPLLRSATVDGGAAVLDELDAQAVRVPGRAALAPVVTAEAEADLGVQAARLATIPTVDLVRELADEWYRLVGIVGDQAGAQAIEAGRSLSDARLTDVGRQAAHRAYGRGRIDTAETVPLLVQVYASELLDRNTCPPCGFIDGRQYATISAGRVDYPTGRHRRCLGGDRCRGTLVFVWAEEAPATVQDVERPRPMTDEEVLADLLNPLPGNPILPR